MTNKINLDVWKITLPIDSSGGKSGTAKEIIKPTASVPPYFLINEDGTLTFYTPTDGATTSGSKYPRTELRELTTSGANASWKISEGGRLTGKVKVQEVPTKEDKTRGRVIVGQIHGPEDELCRLYYDNGRIYYVNDKYGDAQKETTLYLKNTKGETTNIPLDEEFSYTIQVPKGTKDIIVSVLTAKNELFSSKEPVGKFWTDSKGLYYKAGLYMGVSKPGSGAGNVGTGNGKVQFSLIELTHGEAEVYQYRDTGPVVTPTPEPTPVPEPVPTPTPTETPIVVPPQVSTITGTSKGDTLTGTTNSDTISGNAGSDKIDGKEGDDVISGGTGNDTIFGGMGNDVISGGTAGDILTGNEGGDTFVLDKKSGTDIVTDYNPIEDSVLIKGLELSSAAITLIAKTGEKIQLNLSVENIAKLPITIRKE